METSVSEGPGWEQRLTKLLADTRPWCLSPEPGLLLILHDIPEPCLFLSTGIWVTKQREQGPPSMKPQEEPGCALGRGRVPCLPRPGLVEFLAGWGGVLGTPAPERQPWKLREPEG